MADEDEIDVLEEFSFNSCLAQNNQGIPSCSEKEDTVHPQWLLDTTDTNWYDVRNKRNKIGPSRILTGNSKHRKLSNYNQTSWSSRERQLLLEEMSKHGRNVKRISQTIKTKTEAEIQALIEAEHGIHLETPQLGLDKNDVDDDAVPVVVQEEIVTDDDSPGLSNMLNMVTTGTPTITISNKQTFKKRPGKRAKNSLLKPQVILDIKKSNSDLMLNPTEIFYDDDLAVGSTESVGANIELDKVSRKIARSPQRNAKLKAQTMKKIGNHRRKYSKNYDKGPTRPRNNNRDNLRSPSNRRRKDSNLSEDSTKSPKLQIVFSSGQALPVSEGEQVIKIEKKKDSEPESDIEIDIDSDNSDGSTRKTTKHQRSSSLSDEGPIAVPLSKFEPMSRRQKRINLDGEGGYTIMHTESGDLVAIGAEPRRERPQRKHQINLIQCRVYNREKPAPYSVHLHVSALITMDSQAHTSRGEVMGLLGGELCGEVLSLRAYRPAAAAASRTHCDMDPVSQAQAADALLASGHTVVGWHHSHPSFPPAPSELDLRSQGALQRALERRGAPFLGVITSQHWPTGRTASQYRCIRVEESPEGNVGYQFSVKLVPDVTAASLPAFLLNLRTTLDGAERTEFSVLMASDVCPQANITYLEKCLSSVTHHMRSAGYADDDPVVAQLLEGIRDIFR